MPDTDWNVALYDQKHAFVFEYGKGVISLLEPKPGETILDLGCGTGHPAKSIADAGAKVVGMDSSASMVEAARTAYPDIEFLVADARNFSLPTSFDAVFSNATLHWVPEAESAVQCIARTLKPGGRFVTEFGGKGNVAQITTALQQSLQELLHREVDSGWNFPSIGGYASLLEKNGVLVRRSWLFDRPTKLEEGEKGLRNWIRVFIWRMLRNVPEDVKQQALERTEAKLRSQLFRDGNWFADYRRLRVVAYKE